MDKSTACEDYFPALIAVCVILTLTVCLMTALPRTHTLEDDTSAPSDSIAVAGATGRATGSHLHLEIRADGQPADPSDYVGSVCAGVAP